MRILLGEESYRSYGARIAAVVPGVEFVILDADRSIHLVGGDASDESDLDFEVAWASLGANRERGAGSFTDRMARSKTLRWFQSFSAGSDQSNIRELIERGVLVTSLHANNIPLAEYILRSALDHFQDAQSWRSAQQDQRWSPHDYREIFGTQWLIVGVGAIGREVATRAHAFGVTVIGVRRSPVGDEPVDKMIRPDEVLSVLPHSDAVVISAPATAETRHLVDAGFLAAMKEGSVLINVARGALVDDDALLRALDTGIPAAAVLDAFELEPLPSEHPYWTHPRVTLTPHSGAHGSGRADRSAEVFINNLRRYTKGEPLLDQITRFDSLVRG